jgi:hypothetical protein
MFILFQFLFFYYINICEADGPDFSDAKIHLEQIIKNRIPNDNDVFKICSGIENGLSIRELGELYFRVRYLQKTQIGCQELIGIFTAKRNSLHDGNVNYSVLIDNPLESPIPGRSFRSYNFVFSEEKLFLKRTGKRWEDDYEYGTVAYDGEVLRFLVEPENDIPNATISKKISFKFFFQPQMPLLGSLFEASRCDSSLGTDNDVIVFLKKQGSVGILQEQEIVNKRSCVVVYDYYQRIFLDPEYDFSVVKIEKYRLKYDKSQQPARILGRDLVFTSNQLDLKSCGNGVWIPSKIDNTFYSNGIVTGHTVISLDSVKINEGIPDKFFSDIIPPNAFVFDGIRGITYMQSDSPSINSLIKETAKSKRVMIFRYISVISGLVLIFIALLLKYRAYLKAKRERENRTEEIK